MSRPVEHRRTLQFALFLALAAAGALPAAAARGGAVPGLERAMRTLAAGDYHGAVRQYDQILSEFPGTTEARFQKGYALEKLGDFRGAIAEYEATLRLDPGEVRALNNLGFLLVDRAIDLPRGERLLRKAVQLNPDFSAAHDSLGWAEYHRKNFAQAETLFRAALEKDPNNLPAYYHAGVMTLKRGDYARSAMYLRKLVERDPRHVKGLMGLGMAYDRLGNKELARQTLSRALKLVDRSSAPGQEIVRMLNELGPYFPGHSLDRFLTAGQQRTSTLLESPAPAAGRGDGLRGTRAAPTPIREHRGPPIDFRKQPGEADPRPGDNRESAAAGQRRLATDLVRRHLELARLYAQFELYKDAASELETVINLEPASDEARQARDLLPQMTQHEEITQEARLGGYLRMGEALFGRQADEEAKLQYQKVLLTDATHPVANKALAFLNVRSGDLERALSHVDKALAREPRYLEALLIRGYIEARRRQFDRSQKTFALASSLAGTDSEVARYAADMSDRMKRFSTLE
ncbi:MAG: tetratricopeptide repeat protein [Candidatus Wallbacteria bacterium]|nr:tetratricopeptide repeat protein [Candidatus Wallbacteria bacterium]